MAPASGTRTRFEPTVERVAYARGIHAALRDLPVVAKVTPPIFLLRLPWGANEDQYLAAANIHMFGAAENERVRVLAPRRVRKGALDFEDVLADLAEGGVVLVEADAPVPPRIAAAADMIVDVPPVSSEDLRDAAQEVLALTLTRDEADELLRLPQDLMFAAMRPGRSFEQIVSRVQSSNVATDRSGPLLEDLGGYGDAKTWGLELAGDIRSWRRREIAWADIGTGLLLSGPPGTGKTLYAAALARSSGLAFIATSVAQWQSAGHLGDLLRAMRTSFRAAMEKAPSLLFIDEFDSIGDRASFSSDHASYSTQVVNGLLEALDGSASREGVVVVAATNNAGSIDAAFLRPGRLGRHILIGLPGVEDRVAIASTYLDGALPVPDIEKVAVATEGMTGADIAGLAKDARRRARVGKVTLDAALVLSCLPPALPLVGEERRCVSVHEAGHAVIGVKLGFGVLQAVAIVGEVRKAHAIAGGALFQSRAKIVRSKGSYLDEICLRLAGTAAEKIVIGSVTDGAGSGLGSDIAQAADVATLMVAEFGMGGRLRHVHTTSAADRELLRRRNGEVAKEVADILAEQLLRAEAIILEHVHVVEAIADRLESKGLLDGDEVAELMKGEDTNGGRDGV
jgi:ATP-dependent Zn protease